MTNSSVLDILIYVFDRYMLADGARVPQRAHLARDLERAGFAAEQVESALDWLTELAFGHERAFAPQAREASPQTQPHEARRPHDGQPHETHSPQAQSEPVRVFTDSEAARLSIECRGFLLTLERTGVLTAVQRELVIDRLLALGTEEPDIEQLRWVVLMVLSSQPGHEQSVERFGTLMAEAPLHAPH
jgi:Smg protein